MRRMQESPAGAVDRIRCAMVMEVDEHILRCVANAEEGTTRCTLHKTANIEVLAAMTFIPPVQSYFLAPAPRAASPEVPLPTPGAVALYAALLAITIGFLIGRLT